MPTNKDFFFGVFAIRLKRWGNRFRGEVIRFANNDGFKMEKSDTKKGRLNTEEIKYWKLECWRERVSFALIHFNAIQCALHQSYKCIWRELARKTLYSIPYSKHKSSELVLNRIQWIFYFDFVWRSLPLFSFNVRLSFLLSLSSS